MERKLVMPTSRMFDDIFIRQAEAEVHSGAMVALIPKDDFVKRLCITGGEPPEQLHVTLLYLGKQIDWPEEDRKKLREFIGSFFINCSEVHAEIHAHAVFNPNSDEAASVYLIGGDGANVCDEFNAMLRSEIIFGKYTTEIPNDYPFYLPHLTIGYNLDINKLNYTGPIIFDKLRLVFGEDSTDIILRSVEEED